MKITNENEKELINIIRKSDNPTTAILTAITIIKEYINDR